MSIFDSIKTTISEDDIRSIAFLLTLLAVAYLAITHQPIPQELSSVLMAIIGFYFGRGVTNHTAPPTTKSVRGGKSK